MYRVVLSFFVTLTVVAQCVVCFRNPDTSKIKEKMVYASSTGGLQQALSVKFRQISDISDLERSKVDKEVFEADRVWWLFMSSKPTVCGDFRVFDAEQRVWWLFVSLTPNNVFGWLFVSLTPNNVFDDSSCLRRRTTCLMTLRVHIKSQPSLCFCMHN